MGIICLWNVSGQGVFRSCTVSQLNYRSHPSLPLALNISPPSATHTGAGKTSLLNALSGRATYAKVSGTVTMDGRALKSDDLNYVPQFDDLNEYFSPREILTYMSNLKVC